MLGGWGKGIKVLPMGPCAVCCAALNGYIVQIGSAMGIANAPCTAGCGWVIVTFLAFELMMTPGCTRHQKVMNLGACACSSSG